MSKTIDKIRGLLNLPNLTKFYAEARLDDGRLVVTEAESMAIGVEVSVMSDEGNADVLEDGSYAVADLKRDKDGGDDEVSEEMSEFSSEINSAFEHIMERLSAMENEPAANGVSHSPNKTKNQSVSQEEFSSMKTSDRAHAIISNFAKN